MKTKIFAIRDNKAEAFMQPLYFDTIGMAERAFSDAINAPNSDFGMHPEDYSLHLLGEFDQSNGTLEPHPHGAQPIALALQYKTFEPKLARA